MDPKRSRDSSDSPESTHSPLFPDEALERILSLLESNKDRSSASLVSKSWYNAERWSRTRVFIGNCYSVSPAIVARRFPNIRSVTLKGKPRFSDFNLVPQNWGADIYSWLAVFAGCYPFLEELRLKRMTVKDESLEFLGTRFQNFKALSLLSCDGFSTNGLASIATHCRNLTELDIQENGIDDKSGDWLSCFPDSFTSLEILNFASLNSEVDFDALERLASRCCALKVLKVNKSITLDQLQRLIHRAPRLTELGTGTFLQELTAQQYADLERSFTGCRSLHTLSGLSEATSLCLPVLYPACANLTFLNLSYAALESEELAKLLVHCPGLRRLWVLDTVEDQGLEAVGFNCPLLEELRVFPAHPFDPDGAHGVTENGFLAVSYGCRRLRYVLYFCRQMTNAAVATIVQNCPYFTHFRLCIMNPGQPDYRTKEPMDEAFGAVVRTCTKLQRLAVSGLLTDLTFEYIGRYAKNLETLSVAFAGSSDWGMQCVLSGCSKLRKLEIRDCPFGNAALLSGLEKYESMRSLWMSACKVTINACKLLAREMPRLNVEVMEDDESDDGEAYKVYVYRTVAGPRRDAPPFVLTLNLTELDIQENDLDEFRGNWLSCFPENFTSLEILNFASLNNEVYFDAFERLVSRCHKLKTLKVNRSVTLNQVQRLLVCTPGLTELGTGSFLHELTAREYAELERAFSCSKNLLSLSGLTEATSLYLPVLYPGCAKLTFLNLSYVMLQSEDFSKLIVHCPLLQRVWVLDTIGDKGLEAVGENCPFLEELQVFPADPAPDVIHGPTVTEAGFLAAFYGCRRVHYLLYFCREMTNTAVATIVRNCPDFTHFRLCIMNPGQPDYKTNEPTDEAFGAVVKTCSKLRRLGVSGLLTDLVFEHIGRYAKNMETLSVAFAGDSDWAMECILRGCPKLRKLEIWDSPFGNASLLSGTAKYESMRSLWMSACKVTINGCEEFEREIPRLNVEVMTDDESGDGQAYKVYIYRSIAEPRGDAPPFVLTL